MSKLFEIFTSEYVRLSLKKNNKQSIEHKGTIKVIESPCLVMGYLTEEDDEFYFLGFEQDRVNLAVKKSDVSTVEICDPNEEAIDLLDEMIDEDNSNIN